MMQPISPYIQIELGGEVPAQLLTGNLYQLALIQQVPPEDNSGLTAGDIVWVLRNRQVCAQGLTFIHAEHILLV